MSKTHNIFRRNCISVKLIRVFSLVVSFILIFCSGCSKSNNANEYNFIFLDVGQGDSCLIMAPTGEAVLIDCGTHDGTDQLVAKLRSYGVEKISCLVLTHGHDDHCGGVVGVLQNFDVDFVMMPDCDIEGTLGQKFELALNCDITIPVVGDTYAFGELLITVLAPVGNVTGGSEDGNNQSLVLKVSYGDISALFTGDAEEDSEEQMISCWGEVLDADLIKVPHHGSKTASTEDFLNIVTPKIAIISVGEDNSYLLPSDEVVERYESIGSEVYRTDELGDIVISCDGKILRMINK